MNTAQKDLFVIGILLMALFVFIQPLRYQIWVHTPAVESVSSIQNAPFRTIPLGPDHRKNMVAACITGAATLLGLYLTDEQQPVFDS